MVDFICGGGTLVAVRRDVRDTFDESFLEEAGEGVMLNLGKSLVSVVWRRPEVPRAAFDETLLGWSALAVTSARPWLCVGDFNDTPSEQPLAIAGAYPVAVQESGLWVPSRWKGHRCLDYALTNDFHHRMDIRYDLCKVSDHKALWIPWNWPTRFHQGYRFQPTA